MHEGAVNSPVPIPTVLVGKLEWPKKDILMKPNSVIINKMVLTAIIVVSLFSSSYAQLVGVNCSIDSKLTNNFVPIFLEVRFTNTSNNDVAVTVYDLLEVKVAIRERDQKTWTNLKVIHSHCYTNPSFCQIPVGASSDTSIYLQVFTWDFPPEKDLQDVRLLEPGGTYEISVEISNYIGKQIEDYREVFDVTVDDKAFEGEDIVKALKYPHFMFYWSPLTAVKNEQERSKMTYALEVLMKQTSMPEIYEAARVYDILNRMNLVKTKEEKRELWNDYQMLTGDTMHPYWESFLNTVGSLLEEAGF